MNQAVTSTTIASKPTYPSTNQITRITLEAISILLILLFTYASLTKLLEYDTFKLQLSKSPYITKFAGILAWALPLLEIAVSLSLSIRKYRLIGYYAALFLMVMFSAYIFSMLKFSYYIPCSCGGVLNNMDWTTHFWFNISFVILSILGILLSPRPDRIKSTT